MAIRLNRALAYAVGAALGTYATATVAAAVADTGAIEEIVVTAQRRSESIQNVPITVQALTGEALSQMNVQTLDDFVRYLPNVTAPSNGPGQSNIYMRGLSVGQQGSQQSGAIGIFPNVALYLDDQSGQLPGRNIDVYAADLERIEVLEGPQGTLFGGGAQAGVVRYITNKPNLTETEASVVGGFGTTAHGRNNSDVTAVINVPLISDRLAVRAVVYNEARGGYINNVAGTFTRSANDLGIYYANFATGCSTPGTSPNGLGLCSGTGNHATAFAPPPGSQSISNSSTAHDAINPVTYQGLRVGVRYKMNDDWDMLITQAYQDMNADGVFYQMPNGSDGQSLSPLSVTLFNPSYDHDRFSDTSLTVTGRVGMLKAVYAGGYLSRNVDQVQDYTNYARGVYADYYQCFGAHAGLQAFCGSPATTWRDQERNTHQSHEIRLSTPDDGRLRGIFGGFWEDLQIFNRSDFNYKTLPPCTSTLTLGCMTEVGPIAGATNVDPTLRGAGTAFFTDITRGYTQVAAFTSWDYDLIPKVLTLTAGTRYFRYRNEERGSMVSSFGCFEDGPAPCTGNTPYSENLDGLNLKATMSGFKSRANITWHVTPDAMLYYTWSQGYRPGGFNRKSKCGVKDANGVKQYCNPLFYTSDDLVNSELGWKTEFLDHHLQFNGAVYQEDWKNVQINFFDPGVFSNINFNVNGQNFRVRGLEMSLVWRVIGGLTVQGSGSWNKSEQTNSPTFLVNAPGNPNLGQVLRDANGNVVNPYGALGSPTANSPPIQFNMRARYEWKAGEYNLFCQTGLSHTGHSYT
ncbi:MAG: TonB-dependent receptor, partial [Proteobacteria bacterium]|nr:TonB-dependent receptor [Pseudomonadota bacterium]